MTQDEHINLAKIPPPEGSEPTAAQLAEAGKKHLEETKNELYDSISAAGTITKNIHRLMTEIMTELLSRQQSQTHDYFRKAERKMEEVSRFISSKVERERERADSRIDNAYQEIDRLEAALKGLQENSAMFGVTQITECIAAFEELKAQMERIFGQVAENTENIRLIRQQLEAEDTTDGTNDS